MAAPSVAARDRASRERDAALGESLASAGEALQDDDEKAPTSEEGEGNVVVRNGPHYLEGPRFWLVTVSLGLLVFMVNLEIPVVTTSLVAITTSLGGFDRSGWVASSYLLGYSAVIVVFAKFSDIVSRKSVYVLSALIFIIFSAACSAAQMLIMAFAEHSIVFRAFQGVGGGGCFSLSTIIITELVPKERYTTYVSQLSITSTLALLFGPIVGGAIASRTSWRWVFIINVPIAAVALVLGLLGLPGDFPFQGQNTQQRRSFSQLLAQPARKRIDFRGALLLVCAIVSLTAGFEEAGHEFPWRSAYVITMLVLSGLFWLVLLLWERRVTVQNNIREPVLPWTFITNRVMAGIILTFFFLGGPAIASTFQLPQRFELVHGLSGLDAGVRLIPFTLGSPFGAIFAVTIAGRFKVAPIWLILTGSLLQVVGFAILGTLPSAGLPDIPSRIYGGEILAGLGIGMSFTLLLLMIPHVVEPRDHAVGMGAGSQFRLMGSAVAVAVCTAVFNGAISMQLASRTGHEDLNPLASLGQYLDQSTAEERGQVSQILAQGYNNQMLVLCAAAAAQVPSALLLWKRDPIKV